MALYITHSHTTQDFLRTFEWRPNYNWGRFGHSAMSNGKWWYVRWQRPLRADAVARCARRHALHSHQVSFKSTAPISTHAPRRKYVRVCVCACACEIYTQIGTYLCIIYRNMYVNVYICTCVCVHIYIYITRLWICLALGCWSHVRSATDSAAQGLTCRGDMHVEKV